MSDQKELEKLFKNIGHGLKKFSPAELNKAVSSALKNQSDPTPEIAFVLESVAKNFKISVKALKQKHTRGHIQDAKQIAYCVLHFNLGLSINYIANEIFDNWPNSVQIGVNRLKNFNPTIKSDVVFKETYESIESQLLKFITDQNS
ncbi:MAG: hypothetical protein BWY54_00960 [Candidatus Dependentiae bacterium ADurb.Bin331]|nr:MAG: hypothetical protein BWY54_00960 [Candidatus Dependentiae bacterium ADurb.Bin331]